MLVILSAWQGRYRLDCHFHHFSLPFFTLQLNYCYAGETSGFIFRCVAFLLQLENTDEHSNFDCVAVLWLLHLSWPIYLPRSHFAVPFHSLQQLSKISPKVHNVAETELHVGLTWNKAYSVANQ